MSTNKPGKNPTPFPTSETHGNPPDGSSAVPKNPGDGAIAEGIEESFPASDPVSVNVTKVVKKPGENSTGERKAGEDSGKR